MVGAISLVVAVTALAGGAERGLVADDAYEEPVLRLLDEATRVVRQRETTVKDCAPEYHVEAPEGLGWAEALAHADGEFGTDKVKRALFLRKYYRAGQPAGELFKLGLRPTGGYTSTGGGHSLELVLVEGQSPDEGQTPAFVAPAATIGTWVTHGEWVTNEATGERKLDSTKSVLFGPPRLSLRDVKVKGITFSSLAFDVGDKLISFSFTRDDPRMKVSFTIGGNTTGRDNSDFYWAYVKDSNGETIETRHYDEDLVVSRRSVREPGSSETRYADVYVNGVPYERFFYEYAKGCGRVVRKERFILPDVPVDRATLEEAIRQLPSVDPRRCRRARHTLVLAGSTTVAMLGAAVRNADEKQVVEFAKVLERIGSPDAIDILVKLLRHESRDVPGAACDALIHIGEPSRAALLRALESPASSDRAKGCCSYVLRRLAKERRKEREEK